MRQTVTKAVCLNLSCLMRSACHVSQPRGRVSVVTLFLAILVSIAWMAITPVQGGANTTTQPVALVIAVAGPTQGANADRFKAIHTTVEATLNTVVSQGGLAGFKPILLMADDACDGPTAARTASQLVERRVDIVIGHPCTRAALTAADIYAPSDTVFFATSTRHPRLTRDRKDDVVFRLAGNETRAADTAADHLRAMAPVGQIAIVHDRTRYSKALAERVAKRIGQDRRQDLVTATIISGDKDSRRLIKKIGKAAAVFYAGFPLEAGLIYQALREAGSRAPMLTSESVATGELTATFGDKVIGLRAVVSETSAWLEMPAGHIEIDETAAKRAIAILDQASRNGVDISDGQALKAALISTPLKTDGANQQAQAVSVYGFDRSGDAMRSAHRVIIWDGISWQPLP